MTVDGFPQSLRSVLLDCFFLLCAVVLGATAIQAQQNTADIVGTATDASGAIVPGAIVTATNTNTGVSHSTITSAGSGDYAFSLLQVGPYTVRVEAKGFKTYSAPNVVLAAGDRVRVDAKLEVGDVTQTVEVSAVAAPALQTDSSTVGSLVTEQAVQDIPLDGRNFVKLVQLSPGVNQGQPGELNSGTRPDDRRQTSTMSVNGQSDIINNNMVDGVDNNERIIGTIGIRPSVDAIQEVNVSTNLYTAEVGRTGGGVVDIVTKSGTNAYHGSAYEFLRNKVLNANPNYFGGGSKPAFVQNQFGASLGGPIKKDKTFFFGDYEQFRQSVGIPLSGETVPTLCERGLNLAKLQGYKGGAIACPDNANVLNPGDFSDTNLISDRGGSASTGGAGPDIPQGSITPLGLAYFSMFPLPNTGGAGALTNNYVDAPKRTQKSTTFDIRLDQHFSDKDTFYARYSYNNVNTLTPDDFPAVTINPATGLPASSGLTLHPGGFNFGAANSFPGTARERQQAVALSWVHVFRANLLVDLKASYLRSSIQSLPSNSSGSVSNALGFPCNAVSCINVPGLSVSPGLASISLAGSGGGGSITPYTGLGDAPFVPLLQFDNTFQYSGAITWNKGAHSIRIGAGVIRRRATINQSANPEGTFVFNGGYTGIPAGDLLEGLAAGGTGFLGLRTVYLVSPGYRTWEPSVYVQDDWRARKWLTLNLGIRYDVFTPYTESQNRISNWDPHTGLIVSPSSLFPASQRSSPTADVNIDHLNIAPRFGFAATLPRNTVVRGGFGMSFFPSNYAAGASMKNAPFSSSISCQPQNQTNTNAVCPAPFGNAVLQQYGSDPNPKDPTFDSGSMVGKSGGDSLAAGLPVPKIDPTLVLVPAGCTVAAGPSAPACQAPPVGNNPYATSGIGAAETFDYPASYLEQYSLQVEKAVGANVVTVGYVGNMGRHINFGYSPNQIANPTQTQNPLASEFPWLATTGISVNSQYSTSAYNSLQTTFVRRFSKGLTASFNYTWAHGMDNTNGGAPGLCQPTLSDGSPLNPGFPCFYDNPANPTKPIVVHSVVSAYWGNSSLDVADRFAWTADYELPFGKSMKGVMGQVVKGWSLNISGAWQTGLPFTVSNGAAQSGVGGLNGDPDQVGTGRLSNPTLNQWFNPAAFKLQTAGTFGNGRPNQLFGPSQRNLNLSLFKEFPVSERFRLQFRTEVFNVFNTPNFVPPSGPAATIVDFSGPGRTGTTMGGPVGQINQTNDNENPREIQFALKLLF